MLESQPMPPSEQIPVSSVEKTEKKSNILPYVFIFISLVVGIVFGYLLQGLSQFGFSEGVPDTVAPRTVVTALPSDATRIQVCSNRRGALYARIEDIPLGPIYMVHEGQVIGVEFMVNRQDLLEGESLAQIPGRNISVDHVNIGLMPQGHAGYNEPHYHFDFYSVEKDIEMSIECEGGDMQHSETESGDMMRTDKMEMKMESDSGTRAATQGQQ